MHETTVAECFVNRRPSRGQKKMKFSGQQPCAADCFLCSETTLVPLHRRQHTQIAALLYTGRFDAYTPNTAGHGSVVFGVGYTVKLTGYCPPMQVLVRRRRRFQSVPFSSLPEEQRPGWGPRFPPENCSALPRWWSPAPLS